MIITTKTIASTFTISAANHDLLHISLLFFPGSLSFEILSCHVYHCILRLANILNLLPDNNWNEFANGLHVTRWSDPDHRYD